MSDVDVELLHGLCDTWAEASDLDACTDDEDAIARMLAVATRVCYLLGGSRWPGVCTDTVQPGSCGCSARPWPVEGGVALRAVDGTGALCGSCALLHLPQFPVISVEEVRIRGDVLDPAAYKIVDDEALVRVDGGSWPANTGPGTVPPVIEVDYSYGGLPSELGRRAVTVLTEELLLALCNDDSCRLDRRVVSIVREGVTIETAAMPGLVEALVQGHIGLPEVDLFVAAENPSKLRREGRFVIPGDARLYDHRVR